MAFESGLNVQAAKVACPLEIVAEVHSALVLVRHGSMMRTMTRKIRHHSFLARPHG